jgi:two-component system KDP operon response regulator KdpE
MTQSGARILVVDDDPPIRKVLKTVLKAHGYAVSEAENGQEALRTSAESRPDLILLDLGLPDLDGIEVTRRLREWTQVPVIVLSVREKESDKIRALDAGADDYLTKPFGMGELLARIRVSLRRLGPVDGSDPVFQMGDLRVDFSRRQVTVAGQEVSLTPTEYEILRELIHHQGKVLTHRHLLRTVWGDGYEYQAHLLRVNVSNLRRKIEPDPTRPEYIRTESGVGYRLNIR